MKKCCLILVGLLVCFETISAQSRGIQDMVGKWEAADANNANGGLEKAFSKHPSIEGTKGRIVNFREAMLEVNHENRVEKHLSNPLKNASCKRLNMFLRWMVRKDKRGVDFGIWDSIDSSELLLPLDVHTGNIARKLEILQRKQNDWKALEEVMTVLRDFDSNDPVKYDFALFGLGAFDDLIA